MAKLITIHSFRGGTGKSNLTANIAFVAAKAGARVAVFDTDLQSPGVHVVFGTSRDRIFQTLSDFVGGRCELEDVAIDVTRDVGIEDGGGKLFLLPSSMKLEAITRILSEGYKVGRLNEQLAHLSEQLELDYVLLDTHPGLNRETMLSASVCDELVLLVRPDDQDFQGTAVLCEVAKRIEVPEVVMVANKVIDGIDHDGLQRKIEEAFGYPVAGVLPLDPDLARLGSRGIFVAKNPGHPLSARIERIANYILTGPPSSTEKNDDAPRQVHDQVSR